MQTTEYLLEKQTQRLLTCTYVTQLENHRRLLSVSEKSNEKIRINTLDYDQSIFEPESLIDGNFTAKELLWLAKKFILKCVDL